MVDREIYKKRRHINLPKALLKPIAAVVNKALWWPIMSADEVEREFHDQVIDESAKTFKDLGITPGDIKDFTYHYLVSTHMSSVVLTQLADPWTARIPQLGILRPAASNGKGEEGREKVYPRPGRPVNLFGGGRCERGRVECTYATQSIFFLNQEDSKNGPRDCISVPVFVSGPSTAAGWGFHPLPNGFVNGVTRRRRRANPTRPGPRFTTA